MAKYEKYQNIPIMIFQHLILFMVANTLSYKLKNSKNCSQISQLNLNKVLQLNFILTDHQSPCFNLVCQPKKIASPPKFTMETTSSSILTKRLSLCSMS